MSEDFYCDEALSGRTPVKVVLETDSARFIDRWMTVLSGER